MTTLPATSSPAPDDGWRLVVPEDVALATITAYPEQIAEAFRPFPRPTTYTAQKASAICLQKIRKEPRLQNPLQNFWSVWPENTKANLSCALLAP